MLILSGFFLIKDNAHKLISHILKDVLSFFSSSSDFFLFLFKIPFGKKLDKDFVEKSIASIASVPFVPVNVSEFLNSVYSFSRDLYKICSCREWVPSLQKFSGFYVNKL